MPVTAQVTINDGLQRKLGSGYPLHNSDGLFGVQYESIGEFVIIETEYYRTLDINMTMNGQRVDYCPEYTKDTIVKLIPYYSLGFIFYFLFEKVKVYGLSFTFSIDKLKFMGDN